MQRAIHVNRRVRHYRDEKMGLSDYVVDAAYVAAFLLLLGLLLLPYLSRLLDDCGGGVCQ